MTYSIKSTLVADLVSLVLVDDDGTTIKDLVAGNTISLDSGVAASVATGAWKSISSPKYFVTTANGSFDLFGVRWTGTLPTVDQNASPGMSAGFCCHGADNCSQFGNSFIEISNASGNPAGLQRVSQADAHGRLIGVGGGTVATTTTNLPADGATKFTFSANYRGSVASEVFYGPESGSLVSEASAGSDGGFGGTRTLYCIGGDPGQGAQPFKPYITWVARRFFTLTENQSIHNDWRAFFLDLGPTPTITGTGSASPVVGSSLVISGNTLGASQGAGSVTIGGVTQTVTAWSDTSITITVVRGTNKFGAAVNVVVTDNALVSSSPFALTSLQPASGWAYVDLGTPNTVAPNRLQTSPDLASGDQIAYESLSGAVTVASDATFAVANSVTAFQFEAWAPADGWGSIGTQQIIPPWYAPASADTYELAAKLAEFRALLNPNTWFGPVAVEKWFADELATTTLITGDAVEAASANATQTAVAAYLGSITESATAAESSAGLAVTSGTVTEVAAASATQTGLAAFLGAVTEPASANAGQTALAALIAAISEAIAAAETSDSSLTAGGVSSVSEPASAGSTQAATAAFQLAVVEAASAAEAAAAVAAFIAVAAESAPLADQTDAFRAYAGAVAEAIIAASTQTGTEFAPEVFSGGNASIGLSLLAAGARIGNTRLGAQKGRIGA